MKRGRDDDVVVVLGGAGSRKRSSTLSFMSPPSVEMPLLSTASCGRAFCVAIGAEDGKVYVWGKLAVSTVDPAALSELHFPEPLTIPSKSTLLGVASGNFHSLAVNEDGEVWAWGSNARGRLGIARAENVAPNRPVLIPSVSFSHRRVVSVSCGLHHSMFLLEDGTLMAAGCNENGQLGRMGGFRSVTAAASEPLPVNFPSSVKVVRVSSGRHHVLALSSTGGLWAWGKNDSGQLGIPGQQDTYRPTLITSNWNGDVKMFDCGRNHSVVATTSDELWAFGQNVDGQLGFTDRVDRHEPQELDVFRGWSVRQLACGSRQTSLLTANGRVWSWGFILVDQADGHYEFTVSAPREYSEGFHLPSSVASLHAGSTHMLIALQDGNVAIVGENTDETLCRGPAVHQERVYPPMQVHVFEGGPHFRMALTNSSEAGPQTALAQHLMMILRSELDANVELTSPTGAKYHCHRVVLQARCPRIFQTDIPSSPKACKQLFDYIYGQQCDLTELSALELVQLIHTLENCAPDLGMLLTQAEQTFVHYIYSDKEANIVVASVESVMESPSLSEWVKTSLAEHLRSRNLNERDMQRLAQPLIIQASVLSHSPGRHQISGIKVREEMPLEHFFLKMLDTGVDSDFEIHFESEEPLRVHGCFVSRMAFFEVFLRNLRQGQPRVLRSKTPRSAMMSLCRYLYGGELSFTPWEALYLMSPHDGVQFYFAAEMGHQKEVDQVMSAMQLALMNMPLTDTVKGLLAARDLEIPHAESILIDRIADQYDDLVETLLTELQESHGENVVLQVQRQIIHSLLTKVAIVNGGGRGNTLNETMLDPLE